MVGSTQSTFYNQQFVSLHNSKSSGNLKNKLKF